MDEEYIFTRAEFAKMIGMTPNAVRMKMRRGYFADESKYINNKWMFKRPRPGTSRLTLDTGNKRHGYDNINNPVTARKFREQNDMLRIDKKWGHYSEKDLDALLLLAKKEQQKELEERQRKAFEDPFMLAEKALHKKRRDQWLIDQDEMECGEYDRRKERKEDKGYY